MKHLDKLLFVLALTILATGLIGFGIKKLATPAITPNIVFTQWWENSLEKNVLDDLVKEFKNSHEGIEIILNRVSYENLHRELLEGNDSQALPGDVIALDTLWVPELMKKGIMEFQWPGGYQQGLETPLISFINVFYYNVEILKEAGFSRPPKNRSEFLNIAKVVTNKEKGRWALSMGGNCSRGIYDDIFPWIWAAGVELVKDGKPALNSRPVVESLSFLVSLEQGGLIVPGGSSADAEKKLEDFISGRAAFMIAPAKEIESVRRRMGDEAFSVSSVPAPDNYSGKTYNASSGWTVGVNSNSAFREEARLFADFIAGKAPLLSEKLMPGNKAQDPIYSKVRDIAIAGENAQELTGLPWGKFEEAFSKELSVLFAGQASPADAAGAIQKKWETIISSR